MCTWIHVMATSFFYIYVMPTSFFYIYITFTNWRSVQSFFRTQFLPLSERRRTSVRKWKYKSQGRDTWRTSPMISSRNRSLDPLSSPERQIMISRAWSPLRKSSRSSQVSPRCLPGVSQVSPGCLPGVSQVSVASRCLPGVFCSQVSPGCLLLPGVSHVSFAPRCLPCVFCSQVSFRCLPGVFGGALHHWHGDSLVHCIFCESLVHYIFDRMRLWYVESLVWWMFGMVNVWYGKY